tara:strand:- start:48815 stop:49822 length:1008 start_codon:yes stop_codon:yes gene_type:complete
MKLSIRHIHFITLLLLFFSLITATSPLLAEDLITDSKSSNDSDETVENISDPYESRFFRVRGTPSIDVSSINGNIDVIYNPDIDGVQIDLYVSRRFSLWSGTRSLDDFRIIMRQQGNRIIASVDEKRSGSPRRIGDISFHFVIQTSGNANTQLRTVSGNITIDNHEGEHFIQNQSGDIEVAYTEGKIQVVSTAGNIFMEELNGLIFAKTVSGNIDINGGSGEMRLRTVSGAVNARTLYGTLIAASTTGEVNADFQNVSVGVFLESKSGNVSLVLPPDIGYRVEGRGMGLDFRGLIQDQISNLRQRSRDFSLTTGDGEIPVELSSVSGRVTISHSE